MGAAWGAAWVQALRCLGGPVVGRGWGAGGLAASSFLSKPVGRMKVQRNRGGRLLCSLRLRTTEREGDLVSSRTFCAAEGLTDCDRKKSEHRSLAVDTPGERMHGDFSIADYTRADCHSPATVSLKLTII